MNLDVILALVTLGASAYYFFHDRLKIRQPAKRTVKNSRKLPVSKRRSSRVQRSNLSERVQLRSTHQEALNAGSGVQVRSDPAGAATSTVASHVCDEKELTQLAAAIKLRLGGATLQEAIETAFGVKKGGSHGWKRARALYDLATGGADE